MTLLDMTIIVACGVCLIVGAIAYWWCRENVYLTYKEQKVGR